MKFLLPLLLFAMGSVARAATTGELLDELRSAAKVEAKAAREGTTPTAQQHADQLQRMIFQLGEAGGGGEAKANMIQVIEGIEMTTTSNKVEEICRTLVKQWRAEQEQNEAASMMEMQQGFAAALRAAFASETVKELDAPPVAITGLIQKSGAEYSRNPELRALAQRGQQLAEYLRGWQDYVSGVGSREILVQPWKDLLNSCTGFPALIPRSEILARMRGHRKRVWTTKEQDDRAREIMTRVRTLEDIPANLPQLEELSQVRLDGSFSVYLGQRLACLRSFQIILRDMDAGFAATKSLREVTVCGIGACDENISTMRTQLLLYAIPRLLGVQESLPPEPAENAATYLHRVAIVAREKSNWPLFGRAIVLADDLNIDPQYISRDRLAVELFLAGLNQERAGQQAAAVVSFGAALKTGSQIIPAELIGQHLQNLRTTHPQEFQRGAYVALHSPPPFISVSDSRGWVYGNGGGTLLDSYPAQGMITVPPVLTQLQTNPWPKRPTTETPKPK